MNEVVRRGRQVAVVARTWLEPRPAMIILVATVIAADAVLLLAGAAGFGRMATIINSRHDYLWLLACAAGEVFAYAGYVLALRAVSAVDDGPDLSVADALRAVVSGFGVVSATRSSGGFAVDYWVFRRAGLSEQRAVVRVLALGALEYATLAPVALACALIAYVEGASGALTLPWLAAVPGLAAAAFVTSQRRKHRFVVVDATAGRARKGMGLAVSALALLRPLLTRPISQGVGLAGSLLYWTGDIACLAAALNVVDVKIGVARLVVAYATGYVLTRRSLPFGGAGIVELALTFALTWFGVHLASALVAVVIYRLFNFWLPMLPALLTLPEVNRMRADYARARGNVHVGSEHTGA